MMSLITTWNNSNKQTSTITVDSGHTVDVFQRYGDHTTTINLSNADGLDL